MRVAFSALRWILVTVAALVALAVVGIFVLTRTPWGVERVGRYAVTSIGRGIHGRLTVGRIQSRTLAGGVALHDIAITDSLGRPFVHVDSARATYSWRSLLGGQIVLSSLELYRPVVVIEQLPGDSLWNFDRIFYDTTTAPGAPRLVRFADVTVHDGDATVAFPFEQKPPILPSDTARMIMRRVGKGLQRVFYFKGIEAGLPDVLWESPEEPGRLIRIGRLAARGYVWSTPIDVRNVAGSVALHDSVVAFDARELRLPETQGSLVGRVVVHDSTNDYDIRIAGDRLAFADLHWLYPKLPRQGGGNGNIRILTVPRGTLWQISSARLHTPGTNVAGSFGIVTGDTLYFTQVNLKASPFDLKLVQSMLPGKLPIQGLLVGTVVVQGPISALRTHGDMQLAGGPGGAAPSFVKWDGTVDLRRPFGARDFRADVGTLDLALLRAIDPALPLRGSVSGTVAASGRLDQSVRLVANLEHLLPGYGSSRVTGSGNVSWTRRRSSFDLQLEAAPVALDALAQAFPALKRLGGTARGPVTVKGSLADLLVDADFQTPAGRLAVNGRFDLASRRPSYHASGALTAFHVDQIVAGLPETSITGRYRLDGGGSDIASADATLLLDLTGGRIGGVPLHGGALHVALRDGLAHFDTVRLATAAGTVEGRGDFGARADRSGTLDLQVEADSLGALQPLFFPDTAAPGTDLVRHMGGTLHGHATLTGSLEAFDVSAEGTLARALYGAGSAARGTVRFSATALGSDRQGWKLDGSADSLRLGTGLLLTATTLHADYAAPSGSVALRATGSDGGDYVLSGGYRFAGDSTDLTVQELRFGAGRGAWHLTSPAGLRLLAGTLDADSLRLDRAGGGALRAAGRLAWASGGEAAARLQPLDFHLEMERAPFHEFLRLSGADAPAGGRVTGRVDVGGTAGSPRIAATLAVDSARFQELRLDRVDVTAAYADHHADGKVQAVTGGSPVLVAEGRLPMDLSFADTRTRLPNEPIDFTVRADSLPASLATTLLDGFSDVRGRLDGQVKVGGTARAPRYDGALALRDGAGFWLPSGVSYTATKGTFSMAGDSAIQVDATAAAGGGSAGVKGRIVVADWTNPRFDLSATLNNFLAARRRDADVTASGDVLLRGRYRAPEVKGHLRVDKGVLNVDEVLRQYNIVALDDSLLFNVVDTSVTSLRKVVAQEMESDFMRNLVIDSFTVDVGQNAWLRGKDLNVELSGELGVFYRRAADDLRLTGTLSAVRGTYLLYGGRRFDVKSGTVEFVGTTAFDPNLDITAVYRTRAADNGQPLNIQADVTGTLAYPRIALSTDQSSISQSDLVSYLWFGVPTYRLTPAQTRSISSALLSGTLQGYISSGLETFGRTIGLFDYVSLTSGETSPVTPYSARSNALVSGIAGAFSGLANSQVEVGRYFRDDLFLVVSAGRIQTYSAQSLPFRTGARLEWHFRPTWTSEFFIDDRAARVPSLGYSLDQTLAQQKVVGFFLYREWGY